MSQQDECKRLDHQHYKKLAGCDYILGVSLTKMEALQEADVLFLTCTSPFEVCKSRHLTSV